jgi:aminobenzoyl-glutamate utilization protein B
VEINAEVMARYKPELSKYYYDPSLHPTYLDQLGIKFPTLEGRSNQRRRAREHPRSAD